MISENKHLSQNSLQKLYNKEIRRLGKEGIEDLKDQQRKDSRKEKGNTIFLCHSHLDKTIVNKMILLFEKLEIELYVDWMDISMPEYTDRHTAMNILRKIEQSQKFVFLATANALRSRWCNWELGLAYSSKGEDDFAILAIDSRSGKWKGNEYLQLYPEMQIEDSDELDSFSSDRIKINYYGDRVQVFEQWLNNIK